MTDSPTPAAPTPPVAAGPSDAVGIGQITSGAPARGERVAKYNRLMEIALDHPDLPFGLA